MTVAQFLRQLPPAGRREVDRLRTLIRGHLPAGYEEVDRKACIHFQSVEELPLDAIGRIVASMPLDRWVAVAQAARRR